MKDRWPLNEPFQIMVNVALLVISYPGDHWTDQLSKVDIIFKLSVRDRHIFAHR